MQQFTKAEVGKSINNKVHDFNSRHFSMKTIIYSTTVEIYAHCVVQCAFWELVLAYMYISIYHPILSCVYVRVACLHIAVLLPLEFLCCDGMRKRCRQRK